MRFRIWKAPPPLNFEAWGHVAKGLSLFEIYTKANNEKARELFQKAVELDPDCAFAWVMLGWTHYINVRFAFDLRNPAESFKKAFQYAEKAQRIDNNLSDVHALLGSIFLIRRQFDQAILEGQKSVDLGPSNALSHVLFAQILHYTGNAEKAIAMAEHSLRLCPNCPAWYEVKLGIAYQDGRRYEDAIRVFTLVLERAKKGEFPLWLANSHLAINYSMMEQNEKARFHLAQTLKYNPAFSLELVRKINFYKNPKDLEVIFDALRKAGLPDNTSPVAEPHS